MNKVLVVEDNKDNLRLITYALKRYGYEVMAAATGAEGFGLALADPPLFIIMDINLPDTDGIEVSRRLKETERTRDIPIVAITSHAMLGDRERVMAAGCNGYFEKPIDPLTIIDRIHKVIGISSELRQSSGA